MKITRRHTWLVGMGSLLIVAAAGIYPVTQWAMQPPPNWTLMEPGLYMGGRVNRPPPDANAVLNLSLLKDDYSATVYRWEGIPDGDPAPSLAWLKQQVDFIDTQRRAGLTVFVHCDAGVSRSGMVVAAYLMQRNHWTLAQALATMRAKRSAVQPNKAFDPVLKQWEDSVTDASRKP